MCSSTFVAPKVCSDKFKVGLIALKAPLSDDGPVAAATAFLQFDEAVSIHSMATHVRVFRAAEQVFRDVRHLHGDAFVIRESFLCQAAEDGIAEHSSPDGEVDGARVWISGV